MTQPTGENEQTTETKGQEPKIGFKGALASFEHTPLAPIIKSALEARGIDPKEYDAGEHYDFGDAHYNGFPSTETTDTRGKTKPSPIMDAISEGLDNGTIILEKTSFIKHKINPDSPNAQILSKVYDIEMVLKDPEGTILGYAVGLGSDGGHNGHAILSTNDVIESESDRSVADILAERLLSRR